MYMYIFIFGLVPNLYLLIYMYFLRRFFIDFSIVFNKNVQVKQFIFSSFVAKIIEIDIWCLFAILGPFWANLGPLFNI